jgi:hypothetical protein
MNEADEQPLRYQRCLARDHQVEEGAVPVRGVNRLWVMPRDDVISEAPDRIQILARREELEGANTDVARRDAGQYRAGQRRLAPNRLAGRQNKRAGFTPADSLRYPRRAFTAKPGAPLVVRSKTAAFVAWDVTDCHAAAQRNASQIATTPVATAAMHAVIAAQLFQYPARCISPTITSMLSRMGMLALYAHSPALTSHITTATTPETFDISSAFMRLVIVHRRGTGCVATYYTFLSVTVPVSRCCVRQCYAKNSKRVYGASG